MSEDGWKEIRNELDPTTGGFVGKSVDELTRENIRDSLTGLLNKRGWELQVDEILKLAQRNPRPVSYIVIDVDNLKTINDCSPDHHTQGDLLLKALARRLKRKCRKIDIIGRVGGDEFNICLPNTTTDDAEMVKQRLLENTSLKFSIGVGSDIKSADSAMYDMKNAKKNV